MKALIAAAIALAAASYALAAGEMNGAPPEGGTIVVAVVDATAKVLKTDENHRTVTIKDPSGNAVTINVPTGIAMDEIKRGTVLDVRYVESEAVAIGRPGEISGEQAGTVTLAPEGGSPAMTATTKRIRGMIKDIDRSNRELTITGANQRPVMLKVGADVTGFDEAKIGDSVVVEYTEAVAISAVERAAGNTGGSNP